MWRMNLYGVEVSQYVEFGGLHSANLRVEPSGDLLDQIRELPQDSSVGLGAVAEVLSGQSLKGGYGFSKAAAVYWRPIVDACVEAGHQVVWLDDADLYRKMAKLSTAARAIEQTLDVSCTAEQERQARELAYALTIGSNYIFEVEREEALFKRLEGVKPDVAIIGKAFGDYLMLNRNLAQVDIESYQQGVTDDVPVNPATVFDHPVLTPGGEQHLVPGMPDTAVLDQREAILRQYRAVTLGRIDTDETPGWNKTPAWIGSWTPHCRPEGLFEVYPVIGTDIFSEGVIRDALGDASYRGRFDQDRVGFTKKYHRILANPAGVPLRYESYFLHEGEFRGDYGVQEWPDGRLRVFGKFIIKPGAVLYEPIDLDNLDVADILPDQR